MKLLAALVLLPTLAIAADVPVTMSIDASHPLGPVNPVWRYFGYDEANYTYMRDGQKLVGELGQLSSKDAPVYIRCHHLLTSGNGIPSLKWSSTNAYTEDPAGKPVYDWTIDDRIFDTYVHAGAKPYVEIGFTPEAMSTHPQNYPHNPPAEVPLSPKRGQAWPPKDFAKWGELVNRWVAHCVDRYGADEVRSWYWEVWNEPNIEYWQGTREQYFQLYDVTVDAVRRALPDARVGGPETAGGKGGTFLHDFLQHVADAHVPLDFVSFHAKGQPKFVEGHVRMGLSHQLADVDGAAAVIASFPQFKNLPIVIGESDPEGCAACRGPQNGYRNGTMYSSYEAASLPKIMEIAETHGVNLQGNLTWAFEFENEPWFAGFRALATNGVDLPVINVFRLWSQMHGQRLIVTSSQSVTASEIRTGGVQIDHPEVSAIASIDGNRLYVMASHYTDDDVPGNPADITLTVSGLNWPNGRASVTLERVDADHGNSYAAWQAMGSPQPPTAEQKAKLLDAAKMKPEPSPDIVVHSGQANLTLHVPRHGIAMLVITR